MAAVVVVVLLDYILWEQDCVRHRVVSQHQLSERSVLFHYSCLSFHIRTNTCVYTCVISAGEPYSLLCFHARSGGHAFSRHQRAGCGEQPKSGHKALHGT